MDIKRIEKSEGSSKEEMERQAVADRGVSRPCGLQFCGALCKGVTQRFLAGGLGEL